MISACLIVLNEQRWIRQCLDALRTYPVGEVIVLDGGSDDATLSIIREYPEVQLHENPMPFSFAEQRNLVKSFATGEWILSVDADETLRGAELFETLVADHDAVGFSFPTDHVGSKKEDADPHIRLFANRPDLNWEREVHEYLVLDGVPLVSHPSHMGEQAKFIRWTPEVTLVHWAYTASEEDLRVKARRYMKYNSLGTGIQINSEEDLVPK